MAAGISFYGRRDGYTLRPVNAAGEEEMERVRLGQTVKITVVHEQQAAKWNLFWAIADAVAKAMRAMGRDDADKEWVADQLKIATGHCRSYGLSHRMQAETGYAIGLAPRSIDWKSMDDVQFAEFLDRVTAFVTLELLPHLPTNTIKARIEGLLDPAQRRAYRLAKGMPE